jgi:hypothetical protein
VAEMVANFCGCERRLICMRMGVWQWWQMGVRILNILLECVNRDNKSQVVHPQQHLIKKAQCHSPLVTSFSALTYVCLRTKGPSCLLQFHMMY